LICIKVLSETMANATPNFNDNSNPEPPLVDPASAAVAADAGASLSTFYGAFVGDSHGDVPVERWLFIGKIIILLGV
jgi:hypothetical protein